MRLIQKYVPEFILIAVVSAALLLFFRPLPAKGAEFVVRPASGVAPIPAAVKFVVKAAPADQVVAPGSIGVARQLYQVWGENGTFHYEWRPIHPTPMPPPVQGVPAPRPFQGLLPTPTTPITSATTAGRASTSSLDGTAMGLIRIGAAGAATRGGIRAGCATGG